MHASVIGGGVAGLAAAATLASKGHDTVLYERHEITGGRLRVWQKDGFTFDMGPSWYWMPEVFEDFFNQFGHSASDFYSLSRLDPSYRVWYGANDYADIPAHLEQLFDWFESVEKGAADRLRKFLREAEHKYEAGMRRFVWKPSLSVWEYANLRLLAESFRIDLFSSMSRHVGRYFKSPRLVQLMEFPVLFLGAKPSATPALYSMMNYADMVLGTWYPKGGMSKIAEAMTEVARRQGVEIMTESPVERLSIRHHRVSGVVANEREKPTDVLVASCDYHHTETGLLPQEVRNYNEAYWNSRVLAPSCLLFYLGVNKRINNLRHHNLFFDTDFAHHARQIYDEPAWPDSPQFYVCCPSKTDDSVAPAGMENLFVLVPVAPRMHSNEELRNYYFDMIMTRLERLTGEQIRSHVVVQRSYAHEEFINDYHSLGGNAYGLANTLLQTAFMKPRMQNRKLKNMFYAGQLTVPGPGLPPSIISGRMAGRLAADYLQRKS